MPLNRVLVAALAVQVPDRILRVQGQNLKRKMCCGKTCYTVQSAVRLVPVRQMWTTLRLIHVWKKNIETTPSIRLVSSTGICGVLSQAPLNVCTDFTEMEKLVFIFFLFVWAIMWLPQNTESQYLSWLFPLLCKQKFPRSCQYMDFC